MLSTPIVGEETIPGNFPAAKRGQPDIIREYVWVCVAGGCHGDARASLIKRGATVLPLRGQFAFNSKASRLSYNGGSDSSPRGFAPVSVVSRQAQLHNTAYNGIQKTTTYISQWGFSRVEENISRLPTRKLLITDTKRFACKCPPRLHSTVNSHDTNLVCKLFLIIRETLVRCGPNSSLFYIAADQTRERKTSEREREKENFTLDEQERSIRHSYSRLIWIRSRLHRLWVRSRDVSRSR
jgi:hypothetical protein